MADALIEEWEALDLLTALVDKSLVTFDPDAPGGGRYRLLETVRQYARERLNMGGEAISMRDQHRDYFSETATEGRVQMRGAGMAEWLTRFDQDYENIRSALEWAMGDNESAEPALTLVGCLDVYWSTRGMLQEGRRRADEALNHPKAGEKSAARASALNSAGNLAFAEGDNLGSLAYHQENLEIRTLLNDEWGMAAANNNLALALQGLGREEEAAKCFEECVAIFQRLQERSPELAARLNLGYTMLLLGEYERSETELKAAIGLAEQLANTGRMGLANSYMGILYSNQRRYADALPYFVEAKRLYEEINDPILIGHARLYIAYIHWKEGNKENSVAEMRSLWDEFSKKDLVNEMTSVCSYLITMTLEDNPAEAVETASKSVELLRRSPRRSIWLDGMEAIGVLLSKRGDKTAAAKAIGFVDEQRRQANRSASQHFSDDLDEILAGLQTDELKAGAELTEEQAIDLVEQAVKAMGS